MPLERLDHVTVCTRDVPRAVAFYRDVVGLAPGPRPSFDFDGAWLYCAGVPAVHIVDRAAAEVPGVIDHFAFKATGLADYLRVLKERGIAHHVKPLEAGVLQSGMLQLFFHDPDGARIELDFAATERRDLI